MIFSADERILSWSPPTNPGGSAVLYTTLSSLDPASFVTGASCVETDGADLVSTDATVPASGHVIFYLVGARNACPAPFETSSLGTNSQGIERSGRSCP